MEPTTPKLPDTSPLGAALDAPFADGASLIAAERRRQVQEKGWSAAHDDEHDDQSLLHAAGWIVNDLEDAATHESDEDAEDDPDAPWPEKLAAHVRKKYGDDKVRRLTIAGAMIAAEIDRLRRAAREAAK